MSGREPYDVKFVFRGGELRKAAAITLWVITITGFLVVGLQAKAALSFSSSEDNLGHGWDAIDYTLLEDELKIRGIGDRFGEGQVKFNLQFAFSNKLKKDRFLVPPKPREFVHMVTEILRVNRTLEELIRQGRQLVIQPRFDRPARRKGKQLMAEIGEISRNFRKRFVQNFHDPHETSYNVKVLRERGRNSFRFHLIEADRINEQLAEEINEYFFNSAPGAVGVPEFSRVSIAVLSEAMIRLSRLTQEWID